MLDVVPYSLDAGRTEHHRLPITSGRDEDGPTRPFSRTFKTNASVATIG